MNDQYPDGKLNEEDKGAMAIAIGSEQGRVVMRFPHSVDWVGFDPETAMQVAQSLIAHARQCGYKGPLTIKIGS